MAQSFDRAAFLAAMQAAAAPKLQGTHLPGIGDCYKRPLTAGDVLEAEDVRQALKAAGVEPGRRVNVAIGLAQTLCDDLGQPILDPRNVDHIRMLTDLPWDAVKGILGADEGAKDAPSPNA